MTTATEASYQLLQTPSGHWTKSLMSHKSHCTDKTLCLNETAKSELIVRRGKSELENERKMYILRTKYRKSIVSPLESCTENYRNELLHTISDLRNRSPSLPMLNMEWTHRISLTWNKASKLFKRPRIANRYWKSIWPRKSSTSWRSWRRGRLDRPWKMWFNRVSWRAEPFNKFNQSGTSHLIS